MTWEIVLLCHMGVGALLIVWSAIAGNSARDAFNDIHEFSKHLGFLVTWPLVVVYELLYMWRQKRWERKQRERRDA